MIDAQDRDAIVANVVERHVLELAYGSVPEWFKALDRIVHLDCMSPEEIDRITEIKAARDVIVHNQGHVNDL